MSERRRRLKSALLCLGCVVVAVVGAAFGLAQLRGLQTSRAIQQGPVVTGTTVRVTSTGAHGGAWLGRGQPSTSQSSSLTPAWPSCIASCASALPSSVDRAATALS